MRVVRRRGARTERDTPAVVALGYFDGVHAGHAAVIGEAAGLARLLGLRLAVFTFTQGAAVKGRSILTDGQKHARLAALGVQTCYQPAFGSIRELSPEAFFREVLIGELGAAALACGQDFAFGARRAGTAEYLSRLCGESGMRLAVAPTAVYGGEAVSSTRIRAALAAGDMRQAGAMLGRPYELCAPVRHGRQLGGSLGFPTINQRFPRGVQLPAHGVYATRTVAGGRAWPSVTGWGSRPTVDGGAASCETFIPGFEGDLYGSRPAVQFHARIGEVTKYASLDALAGAVRGWAAQAADFFAHQGERGDS